MAVLMVFQSLGLSDSESLLRSAAIILLALVEDLSDFLTDLAIALCGSVYCGRVGMSWRRGLMLMFGECAWQHVGHERNRGLFASGCGFEG